MLEGDVLARCPSCRNTFSTDRAGRQDCPACGKPLVVPEQAPVVAVAAELPEPSGTPWERREQLGLLRAWAQTVQLALFEPQRLFSLARLDRGPAQLGFALLTFSVFSAVGQILERALLSRQRAQAGRMLGSIFTDPGVAAMVQKLFGTNGQPGSWGAVIALTLFGPPIGLVLLYLNAAVTHGVAVLLGQSKRGFPATFAACAYSCAPLILLAVPACGSFVAGLWLIVLTGIGMKETHRISSGGAAATVLVPYALFCCLIFVAGGALVMAMRSAMGPQ